MEISRAAVGVIAGVCLAAGAGGAYIATRGEEAPAPAVSGELTSVSADPGLTAVELSEAIVTEISELEPPPAARPGPAPRAPERRAQAPRPPARAGREAAPASTAVEARQPAPPPAVPEQQVAVAPALVPYSLPEPEPVRAPEPPAPQFVELIVAADSVVGLQVETALTSERARVEDEVVARVTRDVRVGDRVAIPAGATAQGEVTLVERGGRLRNRARLGIRFTSIVLADGTRVPIETDTIYREGDAPGGESAAKIGGGAIGGAIIGGILGGAKGAILGGSAGAGAGTAAVLAGGRNAATLPAGTPVTVRVLTPVTVTVEK
jgi:hypothetical protein